MTDGKDRRSPREVVLEPPPTDDLFELLQKMAKLQEKKYVISSYPATTTNPLPEPA